MVGYMKRLPDYVKSKKVLTGKKLDDELKYREKVIELRRSKRISVHKKAKELGISVSDVLDYEYGYDICPHKKYKKIIAGVHPPFFIVKRCEKCGKIETAEKFEKASEKDQDEVFYNTFKKRGVV